MLAFVGGHLAGGGKGEATACPYAVKVVGGLAVDTALILAFLILVELLEAILGIGIIFDVVALVLLNVTLVLEGEGAPRSPARASRRREWLPCGPGAQCNCCHMPPSGTRTAGSMRQWPWLQRG